MKKTVEVQPAPAYQWKKTTCRQARRLQAKGYMIWWRPDGILSKDPDNDLALYVEND